MSDGMIIDIREALDRRENLSRRERLAELVSNEMAGSPFVVLYLVRTPKRAVACISNMPEDDVRTVLRAALGEDP